MRVDGAPDLMEERRQRWGAIVFDGTPLGEHPTNEENFEEAAQLAVVLVSCDVDGEVKSIRRLRERQVVHTPDFEAELHDGRTIRIEVTQFVDQKAMDFQNHWDAVFNALREIRKKDAALEAKLHGIQVVFDIPGGYPSNEVAADVAAEMATLLHSLDSDKDLRRRVDVPTAYPSLNYLDASYYIKVRNDKPGEVTFSLPVWLSDADEILNSVPRVVGKKSRKHQDYSDDGTVPVWLASFARDQAGGLGLTAIQELKRTARDIVVEPFERIMIANAVAGLLVNSDRATPAIYRSLSVERCEISRG